MTTHRPVFLELWRIHLPIPAVVSILHRVSGVLMVLSIPVFAWSCQQGIGEPGGPSRRRRPSSAIRWCQLGLLVMAWALLTSFIAGIRY
jgi:Succinate dehydrogenase/Fumarate reductase transmembrane subunit.